VLYMSWKKLEPIAYSIIDPALTGVLVQLMASGSSADMHMGYPKNILPLFQVIRHFDFGQS
jgi:cytochrome c oxidase subunit IV